MPITRKLKQLYLSEETVKQMRWHKEGNPADTEAWEALDHLDLEFARDHRSVRLGLLTNDFQPHSEASSLYSCWPVFIMSYNLSPNKCLKQGFVFLALVISSPKEPMKQMNIFLRPLMEEMK
jgi:hypothetical protein